MTRKSYNQTRMGEALLAAKYVPYQVKLEVAKVMRSGKAVAFREKHRQEAEAASDAAADAADHARKELKTDGDARAKNDADNNLITKYIHRDAAVPEELFHLNMYLMTLFFLMCRISFSVASNIYFRKFLQAMRPAFEKRLPRGQHLRTTMAGVHLDEAYERSREITEEVHACRTRSLVADCTLLTGHTAVMLLCA